MRGTTANIDPAAGAEPLAGERQHLADLEGRAAAINRSQAVIEPALDGTVTAVNPNFCALFGYSPEALLGQHHRVLVEASYVRSPEYHEFWAQLGRGQFMAGEFKRLARDGREIWLHVTYNPILDPSGRPVRIVEYASDITAEKARQAAFEGRADAIARAQAVIEFDLDGYVRGRPSSSRNAARKHGTSSTRSRSTATRASTPCWARSTPSSCCAGRRTRSTRSDRAGDRRRGGPDQPAGLQRTGRGGPRTTASTRPLNGAAGAAWAP